MTETRVVDFTDQKVTLYCGDSREVIMTLAPNSIDSCVCDPPYALVSIAKRFGADGAAPAKAGVYARGAAGFMGKKWDTGEVAFDPEFWADVLRVLKPGAHVLAFGGTRTYHRLACAIEDAGFEIRDQIGWAFGQGFPKSHAVMVGDEQWGTALKPAWEPICMARKPIDGTNAQNVLKWGVGCLNIDGCRVEGAEDTARAQGKDIRGGKWAGDGGRSDLITGGGTGRWPANVIHDGSDEVLAAFPDAPGQQADASLNSESRKTQNVYGAMRRGRGAEVSAQSENSGDVGFQMRPGARRLDEGSAARFFYTAKADAEDRLGSKHPTVKPVDLMQYLIRLVTPKGGTMLDCFAGTGVSGEAAWREGIRSILIEREDEYCEDIKRRMGLAANPSKRKAVAASKNKLQGAAGTPLFGEIG